MYMYICTCTYVHVHMYITTEGVVCVDMMVHLEVEIKRKQLDIINIYYMYSTCMALIRTSLSLVL